MPNTLFLGFLFFFVFLVFCFCFCFCILDATAIFTKIPFLNTSQTILIYGNWKSLTKTYMYEKTPHTLRSLTIHLIASWHQ